MFELPCRGWVHLLQKLLVDWLLPGAEHPNSGSLGPLAHPTLFPSSSPVRQYADICLFNTAQYKCPVAMEEAE